MGLSSITPEGTMYKIRSIALKTIEMGYPKDAEKMLRSLLIEQNKELGLCHEDTLATVVLLGYSMYIRDDRQGLSDLIDLIHMECWEKPYTLATTNAIHELKCMLDTVHKVAV
jgi:hypothetical protein